MTMNATKQDQEWVELTRDTKALLIPSGTPVELSEGERVCITQDLGGTYTVYVQGNLARIEAEDADALGKETQTSLGVQFDPSEALTQERVLDVIRTCYDPEIPVNIVDLGLIYEVDVKPIDPAGYYVFVEMTLTAVGCGMGPFLVQDVEQKIGKIPQVKDVDVQLVFDPPWDQSMMSEAAQLQLGLL